jgi:hypothetical protein
LATRDLNENFGVTSWLMAPSAGWRGDAELALYQR